MIDKDGKEIRFHGEDREKLAKEVKRAYMDGFNRHEIMEEFSIGQATFYRLFRDVFGGISNQVKAQHLLNRVNRIGKEEEK